MKRGGGEGSRQPQMSVEEQKQYMLEQEAFAVAAEMFDHFCGCATMRQVLGLYRNMLDKLNMRPGPINEFYPKLKAKVKSWKAQALWKKFDARAAHRVYNKGTAAAGTKVLVIGAGPCGLRTAIEAQLLGAKVVVVEKRDRITRNNVLHLWPFVITDLRLLGAKKFYGKFCAGSIDHISIRQLQCMLMKVALLLGVEVHEGVSFVRTIEPKDGFGFRALVEPEDHAVSHFEFDVLIGADGKRNTLEGFKRKEFRGKLAIAITANFINKKTEAEAKVEEISGVAFIFNQTFFKELYQTTGIDLENIVYYKDETHYFVMTAKKHSLIDKGVIMQDYADPAELLSNSNVDRNKLLDYAREAAEFSTKYQMPNLEFAVNYFGKPDVAMFDFTSMFQAENSCRVTVRKNYRLLSCLVGDSLLEPFWPTGSGCARGFLSSMDAAYTIKLFSNQRNSILACLAQRESIYRLLAQTTPENLNRDIGSYTLDPSTRYPNLNKASVMVHQVKHLLDTDDPSLLELTHLDTTALASEKTGEMPLKRKRRTIEAMDGVLLRWLKSHLKGYEFTERLIEASQIFTQGQALCLLIHRFRPDLIEEDSILQSESVQDCNEVAFAILDAEFNLPPAISGADSVTLEAVDRKVWVNYLEQICEVFRGEVPHVKHPKLDYSEFKQKIVTPQMMTMAEFSRLRTAANAAPSPKKAPSEPREIKESYVTARKHRKIETTEKREVAPPQEQTRRSRKRRTYEKFGNIEERTKRLEEIEENRIDRHNKRRMARAQQTQNFLKSMHMLQANSCLRDGSPGEDFEDYSIYLYRQTAPDFTDRVKELERKILYPDRDRGISSAFMRGGLDGQFSDRIKDMEQQITAKTSKVTEKKPKDLLRSIGKIDQNDWNVKEIEKKIELSKKTTDIGKSRERVPKWSREQFLARQNKLTSGGAVAGDDKYKDVDDTLKAIGKKLKEGAILESAKNKVASIAGQFKQKEKEGSEEEQAVAAVKAKDMKRPAMKPITLTGRDATENCNFCKQRVYLLEKVTAENLIMHRACLKCHHCHTSLRLGNYAFDRDDPEGKFYCTQHYRLPPKEVRIPQKRTLPPRQTTQEEKPTAVDLIDRGQTPERIEFENSIEVFSEGEPSLEQVIDENEWTDKNFGTGSDSDDDISSSDVSDSSDDSVYDDPIGSPLGAHTLQLANDWIDRRFTHMKDSDDDFYEYSSEDDEAESQTEGEELARAREIRMQEVKLMPLPKLPTDTETDLVSKQPCEPEVPPTKEKKSFLGGLMNSLSAVIHKKDKTEGKSDSKTEPKVADSKVEEPKLKVAEPKDPNPGKVLEEMESRTFKEKMDFIKSQEAVSKVTVRSDKNDNFKKFFGSTQKLVKQESTESKELKEPRKPPSEVDLKKYFIGNETKTASQRSSANVSGRGSRNSSRDSSPSILARNKVSNEEVSKYFPSSPAQVRRSFKKEETVAGVPAAAKPPAAPKPNILAAQPVKSKIPQPISTPTLPRKNVLAYQVTAKDVQNSMFRESLDGASDRIGKRPCDEDQVIDDLLKEAEISSPGTDYLDLLEPSTPIEEYLENFDELLGDKPKRRPSPKKIKKEHPPPESHHELTMEELQALEMEHLANVSTTAHSPRKKYTFKFPENGAKKEEILNMLEESTQDVEHEFNNCLAEMQTPESPKAEKSFDEIRRAAREYLNEKRMSRQEEEKKTLPLTKENVERRTSQEPKIDEKELIEKFIKEKEETKEFTVTLRPLKDEESPKRRSSIKVDDEVSQDTKKSPVKEEKRRPSQDETNEKKSDQKLRRKSDEEICETKRRQSIKDLDEKLLRRSSRDEEIKRRQSITETEPVSLKTKRKSVTELIGGMLETSTSTNNSSKLRALGDLITRDERRSSIKTEERHRPSRDEEISDLKRRQSIKALDETLNCELETEPPSVRKPRKSVTELIGGMIETSTSANNTNKLRTLEDLVTRDERRSSIKTEERRRSSRDEEISDLKRRQSIKALDETLNCELETEPPSVRKPRKSVTELIGGMIETSTSANNTNKLQTLGDLISRDGKTQNQNISDTKRRQSIKDLDQTLSNMDETEPLNLKTKRKSITELIDEMIETSTSTNNSSKLQTLGDLIKRKGSGDESIQMKKETEKKPATEKETAWTNRTESSEEPPNLLQKANQIFKAEKQRADVGIQKVVVQERTIEPKRVETVTRKSESPKDRRDSPKHLKKLVANLEDPISIKQIMDNSKEEEEPVKIKKKPEPIKIIQENGVKEKKVESPKTMKNILQDIEKETDQGRSKHDGNGQTTEVTEPKNKSRKRSKDDGSGDSPKSPKSIKDIMNDLNDVVPLKTETEKKPITYKKGAVLHDNKIKVKDDKQNYNDILKEIQGGLVDLEYYSDEDSEMILTNRAKSPEKYPLITTMALPRQASLTDFQAEAAKEEAIPQKPVRRNKTPLTESSCNSEKYPVKRDLDRSQDEIRYEVYKNILDKYDKLPMAYKSIYETEQRPKIVITSPPDNYYRFENGSHHHIRYDKDHLSPNYKSDDENLPHKPARKLEKLKEEYKKADDHDLEDLPYQSEYMKKKLKEGELFSGNTDNYETKLLTRSQRLHEKKQNFLQEKAGNYNPYIKSMLQHERTTDKDLDEDMKSLRIRPSIRPTRLHTTTTSYVPHTSNYVPSYSSTLASGSSSNYTPHTYYSPSTNYSPSTSYTPSYTSTIGSTSRITPSYHTTTSSLSRYPRDIPTTTAAHSRALSPLRRPIHSTSTPSSAALSRASRRDKDTCVISAQSDSDLDSHDDQRNSATEISTDSEFEHDQITLDPPKIFIDDTHLRRPTKVQVKSGRIESQRESRRDSYTGLRSTQPPVQQFKPLVEVDPSIKLMTRTALLNPRPGDYMLSKTASTEGIASKKSLELKKRYLLGDQQGGVLKSESTSALDTKLRSFHTNITECQKLLNPANDISPEMKTFLLNRVGKPVDLKPEENKNEQKEEVEESTPIIDLTNDSPAKDRSLVETKVLFSVASDDNKNVVPDILSNIQDVQHDENHRETSPLLETSIEVPKWPLKQQFNSSEMESDSLSESSTSSIEEIPHFILNETATVTPDTFVKPTFEIRNESGDVMQMDSLMIVNGEYVGYPDEQPPPILPQKKELKFDTKNENKIDTLKNIPMTLPLKPNLPYDDDKTPTADVASDTETTGQVLTETELSDWTADDVVSENFVDFDVSRSRKKYQRRVPLASCDPVTPVDNKGILNNLANFDELEFADTGSDESCKQENENKGYVEFVTVNNNPPSYNCKSDSAYSSSPKMSEIKSHGGVSYIEQGASVLRKPAPTTFSSLSSYGSESLKLTASTDPPDSLEVMEEDSLLMITSTETVGTTTEESEALTVVTSPIDSIPQMTLDDTTTKEKEISITEYVNQLQAKISEITTRKKEDEEQSSKIFSEQLTEPPTLSKKIEMITKERVKQKDIIHDLVMDKLQQKKKMNAEKRLNRARNRSNVIASMSVAPVQHEHPKNEQFKTPYTVRQVALKDSSPPPQPPTITKFASFQYADRLRDEARARARLLSNEDLGLSPEEKIQRIREKFNLTPRKPFENKLATSKSVSDILTASSPHSEPKLNYRDIYKPEFTSDSHLNVVDSKESDEIDPKKKKLRKERERRRSLIQTVSDFFHKRKEGGGSVTREGKENVFSKFRLSPKKKEVEVMEKSKDHEETHYERSKSENVLNQYSCEVEQVQPKNNVQTMPLPSSTYESIDDESETRNELKRIKAITKASRQAELKRLRVAQEIEREQVENEVKIRDLETRGVDIEKALRGEQGKTGSGTSDQVLLKELFEIWRKITKLKQHDEELVIRQKELQLEHRHAQLKEQLELRLSCNKLDKSSSDVAAEGAILNEMLDIVAKRASLRPQSSESSVGTSDINGSTTSSKA